MRYQTIFTVVVILTAVGMVSIGMKGWKGEHENDD